MSRSPYHAIDLGYVAASDHGHSDQQNAIGWLYWHATQTDRRLETAEARIRDLEQAAKERAA